MTITLLTGPSGSGKSRRLIETVNEARTAGRRVSTFMASDAAVRSPDANVWAHGKIGSRTPGLVCDLDHFVSADESAAILGELPPGTLVAVDEARFFEPHVANAWLEASRRGLELLISMPSPEQVAALGGSATEERLTVPCRRCGRADAVVSLVLPGDFDATSLCAACDQELTTQARAEVVDRLRRQAPYPGEEVIYQPVELAECASWRVLRIDSKQRVDVMSAVAEEVAARDGTSPMTYVDVGCNTGYFCRAMARLGLVSQGVDLVADDVHVARLMTSFVIRDECRYAVADVHDFLSEARSAPVDVVSAFSVIQWLILQTSLERGLEALSALFEVARRVCVLEMGYASEDIYRGKLPDEIDRGWVQGVMEERGGFDEIRCYDAGEHGLMRDLFVGFKAARGPAGPPAPPGSLPRVSVTGDDEELVRPVLPALRRLLAPGVREKSFRLLERHDVHLTPVDYYQPIPDTRTLRSELWERRSELVGIDLNTEAQLRLLTEVFPGFRGEYDQLPHEQREPTAQFHLGNGMFDGTDALACYCMIRHFRPRRVVEVGSGFSTRLLAEAALRNGDTAVVAIDPNAAEALSRGFPGLTEVQKRPVEELALSFFEQLEADDVLFIDSSHVSRIGGDVNFLFLEVIPRLRPGVLVHVHDIFLPAEYPQEWVVEKSRFWTEQYLLQAFLEFNSAWEVLLANSYLGQEHREAMRATFPNAGWWGGGSFWMRRVGHGT
jgi:SAM-dependent methyltransferase